jgi:hypothetical protein
MHFGMSAGTHHLVSVVSAEFDIWTVPSGSSVVKLLAVTTPRSCHRPPNYPLESARYKLEVSKCATVCARFHGSGFDKISPISGSLTNAEIPSNI